MTTASTESASANSSAPAAHGASLTPAAAAKVRQLLDKEDNPQLRLRLAVEAGGCAGYSYDMGFDDADMDGDSVVEFDGVPLVVDGLSAPMLDGAVIDYEDTIQKQGFSIENPNKQRGCACGNSFC